MSDYLHTVAARNLESILNEPLPIVQPRTSARFEPAALDVYAPFAGADAETNEAVSPAASPVGPVRDRGEQHLPVDLLAALYAQQTRDDRGTTRPMTPAAQRTTSPLAANQTHRAETARPTRRATSAAEPVQVAPVRTERVVERMTVRELERPLSMPQPESQQGVLVSPALQPPIPSLRESRNRRVDAEATIIEMGAVHPALVPAAPVPTVIHPAVQPSISVAADRIHSPMQYAQSQITNHESRSETAATPPPAIHVTIGRIEVRATPPSSQSAPKPRRPAPVMTLDEYLRAQSGSREGGSR